MCVCVPRSGANLLETCLRTAFTHSSQMVDAQPHRFRFFKTKWHKFPDSQTDNIELGGFTPRNYIMGSHVIFLASFHNNDIIMSQFRCAWHPCTHTWFTLMFVYTRLATAGLFVRACVGRTTTPRSCRPATSRDVRGCADRGLYRCCCCLQIPNCKTATTANSALVALLESFVESLTVVLPFFPHGTMERVTREGQVCVRVCACVCARACVCACVCVRACVQLLRTGNCLSLKRGRTYCSSFRPPAAAVLVGSRTHTEQRVTSVHACLSSWLTDCHLCSQVATANTVCRMFSVLPSCGRPTRVLIYDIHT